MKPWKQTLGIALLSGSTLLTGTALASNTARVYEVTITNLTRGQTFTPLIAATHRRATKLFEPGQPADRALEELAEGGDSSALQKRLKTEGALDIATTAGGLPPGQSVTLTLKTNRHYRYVSVASMLIPTNDSFVAVNGVRGRLHSGSVTVYPPAYDAGTENNDELCDSIPGPASVCGGSGFLPGGGEGFVSIGAGIHGVGDLSAATYDWRNPVARVIIRTRSR